MTTATTPVSAERPSEPFGVKRVLLLVFGSIVVLIALAFLAGGGAGMWALGERDSTGYFTSGTHELASSGYAISSENLDVDGDVPGWFGDRFATARIEASSSQPVFIGIAPTSDVERYLSGASYDQVKDFEVDPFSVSYRGVDGTTEPAPPVDQDFWRVKATGPGTQTISWPLEKGDWSVVAMNADGSRDVTVEARFGAKISSLVWVAIAFLIAGALILVGGATLIYLGARRRRPALAAGEDRHV